MRPGRERHHHEECVFMLYVRKSSAHGDEPPQGEVADLLSEIADVFPSELPASLPPTRSISHTIPLEEGAHRQFFAQCTG